MSGRNQCQKQQQVKWKKDPKYLPKLPVFVGRHTDAMIGVTYLRCYLEKLFQLLSILAVYKYLLKKANGTKYVPRSPHRVFTETEASYQVNERNFLSDQCKCFKSGYQMNPNETILHVKLDKDHLDHSVFNTYQLKNFDESKTTQSLLVRK